MITRGENESIYRVRPNFDACVGVEQVNHDDLSGPGKAGLNRVSRSTVTVYISYTMKITTGAGMS